MPTVSMTVNGKAVSAEVDSRTLLVQFLREHLKLTGTHVGCEHGVCGACTVRVDGNIVRGCLMLAVQAEGRRVETIEGVSESGEIADLQDAFHKRNALQCGFCTPGMIMAVSGFLKDNPKPTDEEIYRGLEGNLCRCTGYINIVKAVKQAAKAMSK